MAKSSIIGSLRIALGLDSAQFQAGVAKVGKSMDALARKASMWGAAVGAAMAGAFGAISLSVRNTINEFDNIAKTAQRIGVSVEELTKLKHAADLSGVSFETLGKGVQRLSRTMVDAQAGLQSAQRSFDALGISIHNSDGTLKSASQIMGEVADRFSQMNDGAEKTGIAMMLFGRAGAELIPMLNGGAAGLRDMMQEAENLGIVIDTHTAKAAEAFNDNLTRLNRAKDGLVMTLTAHLLPSLEYLSERFLALVSDAQRMQEIGETVRVVFNWVAREAGRLAVAVEQLRIEITALVQAGRALMQWDLSGAWSAATEGFRQSRELLEGFEQTWRDMESGVLQSQGSIQRRISAAFGDAGTKAGEGFALNFEKATKEKVKIDPLAQEAARIFEATRTPLEQYQAQIARLNELLQQGYINQDTFNRAVIQAQDAFARAEAAGRKTDSVFQTIGQTMSHSFSSAFMSIVDGSRKVGDAIADILRQLANLLVNRAFQMLFNMILPGGGGGLFGGALPSVGLYAKGTNSAKRGLAIVGEEGPELVRFRGGEQVIPNHELGNLGSGGGRIAVDVGVSVDNDGNLQAYVKNVAEQTTAAGIGSYDKTRQRRYRMGAQFG